MKIWKAHFTLSVSEIHIMKIRKNIENNIDNLKVEFIQKKIPSFIKHLKDPK